MFNKAILIGRLTADPELKSIPSGASVCTFRIACDRRTASVETRYGTVRVKVASWQGKIATTSPEYEDCRRLAEAQDVPLKEVYDEARRALAFRLGGA